MERLINTKARLDKARDTFEKSYYALLMFTRVSLAKGFTISTHRFHTPMEEAVLARHALEASMIEGLDLEETMDEELLNKEDKDGSNEYHRDRLSRKQAANKEV